MTMTTSQGTTKGTFHGVGLGPGDPDLVTVKAVDLKIGRAHV